MNMRKLLARHKTATLAAAGFLTLSVALGGGIAAASASDSQNVRVPAQDAQPETYEGGLPALYDSALQVTDADSPTYEMLETAAEAGRLSTSDYERAHVIYESCIRDAGFTPSFRKTATGLYVELPYTDVTDADALDAAVVDCSAKSATVEALYKIQVSNPEVVLDQRVVAVDCLVAAGAVKSGYSAEQFDADMKRDTRPFDVSDMVVNDCLYGAGYAVFDMTAK